MEEEEDEEEAAIPDGDKLSKYGAERVLNSQHTQHEDDMYDEGMEEEGEEDAAIRDGDSHSKYGAERVLNSQHKDKPGFTKVLIWTKYHVSPTGIWFRIFRAIINGECPDSR